MHVAASGALCPIPFPIPVCWPFSTLPTPFQVGASRMLAVGVASSECPTACKGISLRFGGFTNGLCPPSSPIQEVPTLCRQVPSARFNLDLSVHVSGRRFRTWFLNVTHEFKFSSTFNLDLNLTRIGRRFRTSSLIVTHESQIRSTFNPDLKLDRVERRFHTCSHNCYS